MWRSAITAICVPEMIIEQLTRLDRLQSRDLLKRTTRHLLTFAKQATDLKLSLGDSIEPTIVLRKDHYF